MHFLPPNHVNTAALCDLMVPHYRKGPHGVPSNRKQQEEAMLTLKTILFLIFFNPRTNTDTPWREVDGHHKNRLMKGIFSLQLFPQKQQSHLLKQNVCDPKRTTNRGKHEITLLFFCRQKVSASFEWLLVSCLLCCVVLKSFFLFKCFPFVLSSFL